MRLIGVLVILGGWALAVGGLLVTSATPARLLIACLGIGVSLFRILRILNGYYLERAIWKK